MIFRVRICLVGIAVAAAIGMSLTGAPAFARGEGGGSHGGSHGGGYGSHHGGGHGHGHHGKHHKSFGGGSGGWIYCDVYAARLRQRARSQNPMVWNTEQWRSTLMRENQNNRCVERNISAIVHVEIRRIVEVEQANALDVPSARARPVLRVVGQQNSARGVLARKTQAACGRSGPMILVWTGARAERACAPAGAWRGRIVVPSADLSLDKG